MGQNCPFLHAPTPEKTCSGMDDRPRRCLKVGASGRAGKGNGWVPLRECRAFSQIAGGDGVPCHDNRQGQVMGKTPDCGDRKAAEGIEVPAGRGRSGLRGGRKGSKILPEWGTTSGYGLPA